MTYQESIQYLNSFVNYENIPSYPYKESIKLERIRNFLTAINNPQGHLKCLHIAGTKGKGSTSAFIAYILRQAGYRTGLYTSPHLVDFRERIRILEPQDRNKKAQGEQDFEGIVSKEELRGLVERLKPSIEEYNKHCKYGQLSFFEIYTALAFMYFKEQEVDFAVLETGMGGRLDATNTVDSLIAAITPISYEHTQKLGNTLKEIAAEKAGIIKDRCQVSGVRCQPIVISAPQEKEAQDVISNKCKETGAKLYEVGKDITYANTKEEFSVKGIFHDYVNLKITLLGQHQLINAAVAVGAIEALRLYNINISPDAIRGGFYNTVWPGRCEIISRNPIVVLDGAQNVASMRALKETIKEYFNYQKLILVMGISNDKDIAGICKEINGLPDEIIVTRADSTRAVSPETLAGHFLLSRPFGRSSIPPQATSDKGSINKRVHITKDVEAAKKLAYSISKKEDLVLVCGSLFVVGEFRNA